MPMQGTAGEGGTLGRRRASLPATPGSETATARGCRACEPTEVQEVMEIKKKKRKPTPRPPVKAAGLSAFLSFSYGSYRVSVVALLMASEALSAAS